MKTNLEKWFSDPRSDEFFGHGFVLKMAVLEHLISGRRNLAQVARRHGVCKQAAYRHARQARRIFGMG